MVTVTQPINNTTADSLSNGFFYARTASIAVSVLGLGMSSFSLSVLLRKYLARRDVFDVGLIILEACQVAYCLLCSITFSLDLTVQLQGTYSTEPYKTVYEAMFAAVLVSLLNRNQWTMCMTLFRTVAATNPIAFRHCFTKRMQLIVFSVVFALSVLIGGLYTPGLTQQLDKHALLMTSRVFQSYIPVPIILVCSFIMAYKFCHAKDQLSSSDSVVTSRGSTTTGGSIVDSGSVIGSVSGGRGNTVGIVNLRRNSRVATAIVLCLSISFHLLETPGAVLIMLNLSLTSSVDWFYALNDTLVSLDSAAHFLIFFFLSRNFRRTAAQACGRQRRSRRRRRRRTLAERRSIGGNGSHGCLAGGLGGRVSQHGRFSGRLAGRGEAAAGAYPRSYARNRGCFTTAGESLVSQMPAEGQLIEMSRLSRAD